MSTKIGEPLKRFHGDERFDAIVIGSGIGGLTAAALLTESARMRVLVLERHYVAGGFTHVFSRRGYEWDVGLHYIGDVGHPRAPLRVMFDEITEGRLTWAPMPEVYDRIHLGSRTYDFPAGRERFRAAMIAAFPAERRAIDRYLELVRACVRASMLYFAEKALPIGVARVAGPLLRAWFLRYSDRTTRSVLEELTSDQELISVLTGQFGDYGLPPAESSFAIHAMVANHYLEGAFYPVGGAASIAAGVAPVIERRGGRVLVSADVSEVLIEDGRAAGVVAGGRTFRAPLVISNAGVANTFGRLIPRAIAAQHGLDRQLEELRGSVGHVCLYLGLEHTDAELGLRGTNLWIYPDRDHEGNIARFLADPEAPIPVVYVSFPSSKDPTFQERFPGKATIEVITLARYEWFSPWESGPWRRRGEDYEALKQRFTDRLLEALYERVPAVKGKIAYHELSTPLSTKHFSNYPRGELYGLDHTPDRFRKRFLRCHTPIEGLYLTGQDICSAGVGGGLFGGVLTASAILKRDLLGAARRRRRAG
jgi:all-trans-retinol 13,14-reductase